MPRPTAPAPADPTPDPLSGTAPGSPLDVEARDLTHRLDFPRLLA